jgi:hypothetical protein
LSSDNHGSQTGDNSLNVGVGDFRGAHVNINQTERPTFTPEQMDVQRTPAFGGRHLNSERVSAFGYVSGVASLLGLYFAMFPFPGKHGSWTMFLMFGLMVSVIMVVTSAVLRRRKFEHFFGSRHYLEIGDRGGIYVNRFTATCPWCRSNMHLRHVGPKEGPHSDHFICERNPRQHVIDLDPTVLPPIEE